METFSIPELLFFGAIGLVLYLVLQRWFMAVDAQLSNQRRIIELLTKLVDKDGEEKELKELKRIIRKD